MEVTRKQSTPNFLKNKHFFSPDTQAYMCVSSGKKCMFLGKIDVNIVDCSCGTTSMRTLQFSH